MKDFESKLNRLEEINSRINSSDIEIEEAMTIFEEGIKIAGSLQKELDKMERKVEILVNKPDTFSEGKRTSSGKEAEEPNLQLFPELEE